MRKFIIKTMALLLAIGGVFIWLRVDASVLAGASVLGLDDSSDWLAANSQDPKPFDLLSAADAGMLRVALPWGEVNSAPGAFVWAYQTSQGYKDFELLFSRLEQRGIKPVLVLSGSPSFLINLYPQQPANQDEFMAAWEIYVRAAVQQFGNQVSFWQIGDDINDPAAWGKVVFPSADAPSTPPDPALYADMLKSANAIIKSADSSDTILLGGLGFGGDCTFHPVVYLQALEDQSAWFAFDAISIKLPALTGQPESTYVDACPYAPVQTSGMPVADNLRAIADFTETAGTKPIWVNNLSFSADFLARQAAERGTLSEVIESDYLSRATAILLTFGGAEKVFWRYTPTANTPGAIALQTYANISRSLGGSFKSEIISLPDSEAAAASFFGNGKRTLITWRKSGGEEAQPTVIPGMSGFDLHAWSADADSLKNKNGFSLKVDSGGSTALMLSERPVLISAAPGEIKEALVMFVKDSLVQAGNGLKAKTASFIQAQKANAARKVSAWVDTQQRSLMQTIKESFNQWLQKSLGLAKE